MPTLDPQPVSLSALASVFEVVRFDRTATGSDRFELLPNVACDAIHYNEGATVPTAEFRYLLDSSDPSSPYPFLWEEIWPLTATGAFVVNQDDELLVYETLPDGSRVLRFDGFAVIPQVDHSEGMSATFLASGVGVRLWDEPVSGSLWRDASDPLLGASVPTELECWFNKENLPNRTPTGSPYVDDSGNQYPCFLDPLVPSPPGFVPTTPDFWTLADVTEYLFFRHNTFKDANDKLWVSNPKPPTGGDLGDYLKAVAPLPGQEFYDLSDSSTYVTKDVVVRSFDANFRPLMEAVEEQLGYYGFRLCFTCKDDPDDPGAPLNELIVYRVDGRDGNAPKTLYYPAAGAELDASLGDFDRTGVARDNVSSFNEFQVVTRRDRFEVSVVLAEGFEIAAGDAAEATIKTFDLSALVNATSAQRKKYRYFTLDEAGLGHWDWATSATVVGQPPNLDDVFGAPIPLPGGGDVRQYVNRLRGPIVQTLFSLDDAGEYRKADLSISRDYGAGKTTPGLWDGTGTWRTLGGYGWKADPHAIAIWLTAQSPETWSVPKGADDIVKGDVVHAVTSLAAPAGNDTRFWLRLTCVIEGDFGISAVAARRDASPSKFASRRVIDAKDHWVKDTVCKSSLFNTGGQDEVDRDDTDKAQAHADALRDAHEFPSVAGSFALPGIRDDYGIGDFISQIQGRSIDLNTAAGTQTGESPRYPVVVGFTWTTGPQTTVLKLSDRRSEPEKSTHDRRRRR